MNASEQIREALAERPLTVNEIFEETGIADISIRRILGTAIAFGAVTAKRNPGSRLLRYELDKMLL